MLSAVQLNGELERRAVEIQDVIASGMLSAEAGVIDLRAAQFLPQPSFDIGGISTKPAGTLGLYLGPIEARGGPYAFTSDPPPPPPPSRGGGGPQQAAPSFVPNHQLPFPAPEIILAGAAAS